MRASALLALAMNVLAWVFYFWARAEAQREPWFGGIVQGLLAFALAGGGVLVALLAIMAVAIDAHDREERVGPTIRLGLIALGVSLGSIVLFLTGHD